MTPPTSSSTQVVTTQEIANIEARFNQETTTTGVDKNGTEFLAVQKKFTELKQDASKITDGNLYSLMMAIELINATKVAETSRDIITKGSIEEIGKLRAKLTPPVLTAKDSTPAPAPTPQVTTASTSAPAPATPTVPTPTISNNTQPPQTDEQKLEKYWSEGKYMEYIKLYISSTIAEWKKSIEDMFDSVKGWFGKIKNMGELSDTEKATITNDGLDYTGEDHPIGITNWDRYINYADLKQMTIESENKKPLAVDTKKGFVYYKVKGFQNKGIMGNLSDQGILRLSQSRKMIFCPISDTAELQALTKSDIEKYEKYGIGMTGITGNNFYEINGKFDETTFPQITDPVIKHLLFGEQIKQLKNPVSATINKATDWS